MPDPAEAAVTPLSRWVRLVLPVALGLAALMLAFGISILARTPAAVPAAQRPNFGDWILMLGSLEFVAVGFLIARRQPRNVIGWMLLLVGIWLPLSAASYYQSFARYAPDSFPASGLVATIAELSFALVLGVLIVSFLVFPDGRLLSRRWLPFVALGVVAGVMSEVSLLIDPRVLGSGNSVAAALPLARALNGFGFLGFLVTGVSGVASIFLRYRRGTIEVKRQLRWVFVSVVGIVVGFTVAIVVGGWFVVPELILAVVLPATIGFAVLKYRLYDIDVVISRTVVYGALAVGIALVYVGLVAGVGSIVGRGTGANLILSLVATALVGLAFQPARERLQRAANRLVYGKRATPYEVLSDFSHRLAEAYANEELLPRMARVLGEGTGAQRAEVWLRIDDELRRVAVWPADSSAGLASVAVTGQLLPTLDASRAVAVRHRGELLGALTISKRAGEALTPIESSLLEDLASQAGLMLRNVGLTRALMENVKELRASRQRLVTAQDEERRRLERDLHDGAQQHLVALRVNLGLAKRLARTDPEKTTELLAKLETAADDAVETLRDLARGIYPPLLADRGLKAALEAQGRKATLPVEVVANGVGRYAQEVEAAVYYCCLEALQNIQKYARASHAGVRLDSQDGALRFSVSDDGAGFDIKAHPRGAGMQNMADRLDALGGVLTITAAPGHGTVVSGTLPAVSLPAAAGG